MNSEYCWEPEEIQVPKEAIEKVTASLLFAEEEQWLESASPLQQSESQNSRSCCNNHESQDDRARRSRCGFKLLRHGNSISQIHSYFQNLEPRRYCLSLTTSKILDRPNNRIRLVRGESRIEQNPPREEGASGIRYPEAVLNDKEWELYEKVVLCCQIPVLSAPPVPSPYSPSSSHGATSLNAPTRARFGSCGQISYHFPFDDNSYSPPPRDYVFSPFKPSFRFNLRVDEVSPDDSVQPEQLQELTRRTFGLNKRQHTSQEKIIRQKMQPKTADRVLVEDLLTQLSLLHKNFHPYYRIQSFLDKNGYDQWIESEKDHINRLVRRFWNSPLPSLNDFYPIHVFDAHEGYKILLSKLIREESNNKTCHSVFGDTTPTSPLSPASCRLLREFGLRYGVGELYRRLLYLQYLVNHFECEVWFIQHVTYLVEMIMALVTNTPEIYVKEEFLMCIHILSLLHRLCKYYLTRVTRLFKQNSPPGGVASLVAMAAMVQEAAHFVKSTFPAVFMSVREALEFVDSLGEEPFETLLASYLKEEVVGRYERFKVIATVELHVSRYENSISPQLLNILILNIRDEITYYRTYYQAEFDRFLDFAQLATVTFYQLMMDDVLEMCRFIPRNISSDEVDLRMLSLAFRLSVFDKDNAKYLKIGMQTWREPFLQLSLIWMDVIGRYLEDLVPVLLQRDHWHVTSITREDIVSKPAASTVRPLFRTQCITRSDRSAFTPVRCGLESDLRECSTKQRKRLASSSPNLSAFKTTVKSKYSSTSSSEASNQSVNIIDSPTEKPSFKGKIIVTNAQIHVPDVQNKTLTSSNETEFIGDVTFQNQNTIESRFDCTQHIEDIDKDEKNVWSEVAHHTRQLYNDKLKHAEDTEHGALDILGSADKTEEQMNSLTDEYVNSSERFVAGLTGYTGQEPVSLDNNERSARSETSFDDTLRATPYENDDKKGTEGSNTTLGSSEADSSESYSTPKSSLSEKSGPALGDDKVLPIKNPTTLFGESTFTQITADKVTDGVVDTPLQSVEGTPTAATSETAIRSTERLLTSANSDVAIQFGEGVTTTNTSKILIKSVEEAPTTATSELPIKSVEGARNTPSSDIAIQFEEGATNTNTSELPIQTEEGATTKASSEKPIQSEERSTATTTSDIAIQSVVGASNTATSNTPIQSLEKAPNTVTSGTQSLEVQLTATSAVEVDLRSEGATAVGAAEAAEQNVEFASSKSVTGAPVPSNTKATTPRQLEECVLKFKTSCQNCPHQMLNAPTDIEHLTVPLSSATPKIIKQIKDSKHEDRFCQPLIEPNPLCVTRAAPKNKLLTRTLAAENGSVSSVPTEYCSFPSSSTSYGTILGANKSSDDMSSDYGNNSETSYQSFSEPELNSVDPAPASSATRVPTKTEVVPVSGSVVDLLCCIQRLTSFACHLCKVLCPNEPIIPGSVGQVEMEENRTRTMEIKTTLCTNLIRIVKRIVKLFVDDILSIETCGMSEDKMIDVLGLNITRHLISRYRSGEVIGCRLNHGRKERCNMTSSSGEQVKPCAQLCKAQNIPTGCELPEEKMGLRSTDVIILKCLLSWLHDRMASAIVRSDSGAENAERLLILSESYCENGPTLSDNNQGAQQDSCQNGQDEYLRLARSLDVSLDECSSDLEGNLNAHYKLIAYRFNKLFKKILHQLLCLSLPSFSVRKRLQPALEFLQRRLTAMRRVMFPDNFMVMVRFLWRHIAQDFSEEVEILKDRRPGASEHAELLLMSLAHLMQFFHNQKQGISFEELDVTTEQVTKHIELYTSSTSRLIRLYRWLHQQMFSLQQEQTADEFTSSISTSSHHSRSHSPADHLIEALRSELHATSKCFSGSVFVDWVRKYVQKNGYDSLGVCIGISDTDTGIELGQYLLERNLLVCVREPTHLSDSERTSAIHEATSKQQHMTSRSQSRGAVVVNTSQPSGMRINEISVKGHNSSGSCPNSSRSASQLSTEISDLSDSSEESDTQGLLDSVDIILQQARSTQSLSLSFHNHPNVFYSFISDEEGSGGELKYKLAFIDRFSVGVKLQHIICALYTRKDDKTAKFFLERLSMEEVAHALGYKEVPFCFNF